MPKLSSLKVDTTAEVEGVWHDFDLAPGVRFKIARAENPKYAARVSELVVGIRGAWEAGLLTAAQVTDVIARAMSETILVGWENVDEGPYSPELAYSLLVDPALHDMREWIMRRAGEVGHYRQAQREAALGNSLGSSNGSASGVSPQTSCAAA